MLRWFADNARDLPWRRNPTPYRVWVSEIMLQQTRVEAVREKYTAFLRRFPDVRKLARASQEAVLAAWSGLGYYRRARQMHAAARLVVANHGGRFPRDADAIVALPGIGRYTAGAIGSMAWQQPVPIVDGNIERVFARWHGIEGAIKSAPVARRLWTLAQSWVETGAAAGHTPCSLNQSLMELGALVCTPRAPRCGQCPVAVHCRARATGSPESLPRRAAGSKAVPLQLVLAGLRDARGRIWLQRRQGGDSPLPAGLWEFPHCKGAARSAKARLESLLGCTMHSPGRLVQRKHSIMHWKITLTLLPAFVPQNGPAVPHLQGAQGRWFTPAQARKAAQSGATAKLLQALLARE